jgi:PadR family transcriptional regulator, regulatory protein AphA
VDFAIIADSYLEVARASALECEEDALQVVAACFESGLKSVLLPGTSLPDKFFTLASGFAGQVLQRFRNYQIRVALVLASEHGGPQRFREMVAEENRGAAFRVFEDHSAATAWLLE